MMGVLTITVKCPVCSCDVSGQDRERLSSELRAHLIEAHAVTEEDPRGIKGGRARLPSSMARLGGEMQEDLPESAVYDDDLALRGDALYGVDGPPSHAALALRCPFCDEEVCGQDEDELSKHLREHVREGHGIKAQKKS